MMHPGDVSMTMWGLDSFDDWHTLRGPSNPSYTYDDVPMIGWRKNVSVRMGGKSQGTLEVSYTPPDGKRRLKNKIELNEYLMRNNMSTFLATRFDFRGVYCVCHEPEDGGSYLECSFGRAGCHGWLHPQCVGLGRLGEHELRRMATVVCPLCTVYLDSIGAHDFMRGKLYAPRPLLLNPFLCNYVSSPPHNRRPPSSPLCRCLGQLSLDYQPSSVAVHGTEIFETAMPHSRWGLVSRGPDGDPHASRGGPGDPPLAGADAFVPPHYRPSVFLPPPGPATNGLNVKVPAPSRNVHRIATAGAVLASVGCSSVG